MVAVISGTSLGLVGSSLSTLGLAGQFGNSVQGRSGEKTYLNAATGNLVIQDLDDTFSGLGLSQSVLRTYNSLGALNNQANKGWLIGQTKTLTVQADGSLLRTDSDGSTTVYKSGADPQVYVETGSSTDGTSPCVILHQAGNSTYKFINESTQCVEIYQDSGRGLLLQERDSSGNGIDYSYDGQGRMTKALHTDGDYLEYVYDNGRIRMVSAHSASGDSSVLSTGIYSYDESTGNLLSYSLQIMGYGQFTPQNYVTNYSYYDGTNLIKSITQSDGSKQTFEYDSIAGSTRLTAITNANGERVSVSYDYSGSGTHATYVTDSKGNSTKFVWDTNSGQLVEVRSGITATNQAGLTWTRYEYNDRNDVTKITDGEGRIQSFTYDQTTGLLTRKIDAAGTVTEYTYNSANQVSKETVFLPTSALAGHPTEAEATVRVYAESNATLVRFLIDPDGSVTEFRYDSHGSCMSKLTYSDATYPVPIPGTVPTEADMAAWASARNQAMASRTDYRYNFRGQLASETKYANGNSFGSQISGAAGAEPNGYVSDLTDSSTVVTQYHYDFNGNLRSTQKGDGDLAKSYVYDQLNRLIYEEDFVTGKSYGYFYDDGGHTLSIYCSDGTTTVELFDTTGRLLSSTVQGTASSSYRYDAVGYLISSSDATGLTTRYYFDEAGRKVGEADPTGILTEYVYNHANQVVETIRYGKAVDPSALNGNLASLRPAASPNDERNYSYFDKAGRLAYEVDTTGQVTAYTYDGNSRVLSTHVFSSTAHLGSNDASNLAINLLGPSTSSATVVQSTTNLYGAQVQVANGVDYYGNPYFNIDNPYNDLLSAPNSLTFDGIHSVRVWHQNGTESSISQNMGQFQAGETVTVTAIFKAQPGTYGQIGLLGSADAPLSDQFQTTSVIGNGEWQRITLTHTMTQTGSLSVALYGDRDHATSNEASVVYDMVKVVSTNRGVVIRDGFEAGPGDWAASGRAADWLTSSPATSTATTFQGTGALRIWHMDGLDTSVHQDLGQFVANEVVTATVWFKTEAGVFGKLRLSGSAGAVEKEVEGNGTWQKIDISLKAAQTGNLAITLCSDPNRPTSQGTCVLYDQVQVNSSIRGSLLNEGFEDGFQEGTWSYSDQMVTAGGSLGGTYFIEAVTASSTTTLNGIQAMEVLRDPATDGGAEQYIGTFQAGDDVTATAWFKCPIGENGRIYLGDPDDRTQGCYASVQGDGDWQRITVTHHMNSTGSISLILYGGGDQSQSNQPSVIYDDPTVMSAECGMVMRERFEVSQDDIQATWQHTDTPSRIRLPYTLQERVINNIYDHAGRLIGAIDAEGYLTGYSYDASGHQTETVRYKQPVASFGDGRSLLFQSVLEAARTAGSLAPFNLVTDDGDIHTRSIYDTKGLLVAEVDGENYVTEYFYDIDNRLYQTVRYAQAIAYPSGTLLNYDSIKRQLHPEDSANLITQRTYSYTTDQVWSDTDAEGNTTSYFYDSLGHITSKILATGTPDQREFVYHYDSFGRIDMEMSGRGADALKLVWRPADIDAVWNRYATKYTYDAAGRRTSETGPAPDHRKTLFFYDNAGRLTHTVNADGEVTETKYDALGHSTGTVRYASRLAAAELSQMGGGVLSIPTNSAAATILATHKAASQDNIETTVKFDNLGRVTETVGELGQTTSYLYNAFGEVVGSTSMTPTQKADGTPTTSYLSSYTTYDRRGLKVSVTSGTGNGNSATTVVTYDAFGRAVRTTLNGVFNSQTDYDKLGRAVQICRPFELHQTKYDAFGRVTEDTVRGQTTTYQYDRLNRQTTMTTPEKIKVVTTHNREGQTYQVIDGNGYTTTYQYDLDGNLLLVTGPGLNTSPNVYDEAGLLKVSYDANGIKTSYTYDASNRVLTKVVDPDTLSHKTTYVYDGLQCTITDPSGMVTQITTDKLGDVLTQVVDVGGLNLTTIHTYDGAGRLLTERSPGGSLTRYEYDSAGHRIKSTVVNGTTSLVTEYTYDSLGRLTAVKDPGQGITRYAYDAADRITLTMDAAGGVTCTSYDSNGRIGSTTRYTGLVTPGAYSLRLSADEVQTILNAERTLPGNQALTENRIYDKDGRLKYTVDANGGVVYREYDGNGNVTRTVAYANAIDRTTWTPYRTIPVVADATLDHESRTVYDGRNRAIYTLSSVGDGSKFAVVARAYDRHGNVQTRAYANPINPPASMKAADIETAISQLPQDDANAVTYQIFDSANRLSYAVDGNGAVTKLEYDRDGNVTKHIAFAKAAPAGWWNPAADSQTVPVDRQDPNNRVTLFGFDAVGRQTWKVDALGGATQTVYDANGNVLRTIAYASALSIPPSAQSQLSDYNLGSLSQDGARITRAVYDTANRLIYAIDAKGDVVKNTYDANGHVIATTAYASPLALSQLTALDAAAPKDMVGLSDGYLASLASPDDRTTLHAFDAAGRCTLTADSLGYVTRTVYDALGRATTITQFDARVTTLKTPTDLAAYAAPATGSSDREVTYTYDGLGNLLTQTDAMKQNTETFAYNGLGEKIAYTNGALNATWTYQYDAAGHLAKETTPPVNVTRTTTNASGGIDEQALNGYKVVTKYAYDAFGNLRTKTEGELVLGTVVDDVNARQTTYKYDAVGHTTHILYGSVGVYDAADLAKLASDSGGAADRANFEKLLSLETVIDYNLFGEAYRNVDVGGNTSYKIYDKLGHVKYDRDALGYVTQHDYTVFGEEKTMTRYATAVTLTPSAGGPSAADVAAAITHVADLDRTIQKSYDALGRLERTTQTSTYVTLGNDTGAVMSAVTEVTYNAFGEVFQKKEKVTQDTWAVTTSFYNLRGQLKYMVDAMGFVTYQEWDSVGNLKQKTEYANPLTTWNWASAKVSDAAPVANPNQDRTTAYTYDLDNRKTSETLKNVEYSTGITDASSLSGLSLTWDSTSATATVKQGTKTLITSTRGDVTIRYDYDGAGRQVRTTDALNNASTTYYDTLGRIIAVASPARTTSLDGTAITPLTVFKLDTFGKVVERREYANGASQASLTTYTAAQASDQDRVELTAYDAHGNAIQTMDTKDAATYAQGTNQVLTATTWVARFMSYDALGHLAKTWQTVKDYDGTAHNLYTAYKYDAVGQQVAIYTPAPLNLINGATTQQTAGSIINEQVFNAFGEIWKQTDSSFAGANRLSYYDQAGHLWKVQVGDGNYQINLYDLLGRQTTQLSSAGQGYGEGSPNHGLNLATLDAATADALGNNGLRRTTYQLDLLGRAVIQTLPQRSDLDVTSDYRPIIERTYDRWGNILSQSTQHAATKIGPTTYYFYNALNQVIREVKPDATHGTTVDRDVNTTTYMFYDKLGHQVGIFDANNHLNGQTWDGAGQLATEIHADSGAIHHFYDAFGNQVKLLSAEQRVTLYGYNLLGQNISVSNPDAERYGASEYGWTVSLLGSGITEQVTYDEAGHRLTSTNGAGEVTSYKYDLRGNIISTKRPGNSVSFAAYDSQGRQIMEKDANNNTQSWEYDFFGTLIHHTDLGQATYSYEHDNAGQLIHLGHTAWAGNSAQSIDYSFDAAGQVTQIKDNTLDKTTKYGYNAAGNHILEFTHQGTYNYQNQTLMYDYQGNLKGVHNDIKATGSADIEDIFYTYDQVGNKLSQTVTETQVRTIVTPQYIWIEFPHDGKIHVPPDDVPNIPAPPGAVSGYWAETGTTETQTQSSTTDNYYYAYNEMNLQILVDGSKNSDATDIGNVGKRTIVQVNSCGEVKEDVPRGHILKYDKDGNRIQDTYWGKDVIKYAAFGWAAGFKEVEGPLNQYYTYDGMNRLSAVYQSGYKNDETGALLTKDDGIALDFRKYDGASRLVAAGNKTQNADYLKKLLGTDYDKSGAIYSVSLYNQAGLLRAKHVENQLDSGASYNLVFGATRGDVIAPIPTGTQGYDATGNVLSYQIQKSSSTTTDVFTQVLLDGYKAKTTTETVSINGDQSQGSVDQTYDANGFLIAVTDSTTAASSRTLVNDANGQVLLKNQQGWMLRQIIANGNVVGMSGFGVDPEHPGGGGEAPKYIPVSNYDLGYTPVTNNYPEAGVGQYIVHSGDTLQSIALSSYGDSSLWYLIADANGLTGNSDLRANQAITIPNKVGGTHDTSSTHTPYDASKIIGSTSPNFAAPQASGGCGGVGMIIMIAVAIIVTIYTAGAAATLIGTLTETSLGAAATAGTFATGVAALSGGLSVGATAIGIAAAGIGAAVGSIASQEVGRAMGVVDHFSWSNVGTSALSAMSSSGVGAWLGKGAQAVNAEEEAINPARWAASAGRMAVSTAMTQGTKIMLRMQSGFDWTSELASTAGAFAGGMFGDTYGDGIKDQLKKGFVEGAVGGFAGGMVSAGLRGESVDTTRVALDAFGNALGSSLAKEMAPKTYAGTSNPYISPEQQAEYDDKASRHYLDRTTYQLKQLSETEGLSQMADLIQTLAAERSELPPLTELPDLSNVMKGLSTQPETLDSNEFGGSTERIARAFLSGTGATRSQVHEYDLQIMNWNKIRNTHAVSGPLEVPPYVPGLAISDDTISAWNSGHAIDLSHRQSAVSDPRSTQLVQVITNPYANTVGPLPYTKIIGDPNRPDNRIEYNSVKLEVIQESPDLLEQVYHDAFDGDLRARFIVRNTEGIVTMSGTQFGKAQMSLSTYLGWHQSPTFKESNWPFSDDTTSGQRLRAIWSVAAANECRRNAALYEMASRALQLVGAYSIIRSTQVIPFDPNMEGARSINAVRGPSLDPGLDVFIEKLEAGGVKVLNKNVTIVGQDGAILGEVDVVTEKAIIQYKNGASSARAVIDQVKLKTEPFVDRPVWTYVNDTGKAGMRTVNGASTKINITNNLTDLINKIK